MSVYWTSTKAPVHLFKRDYESAETAQYVTENACVDATMLAADLKINHFSVRAYQRRLGVRKISASNPRKA
jgi:hypothetical protein